MSTKNNYRNGAARERRILAKYEKMYPGSIVLRSAGSHSKIDCVIVVPSLKKMFLIQSKPRSMSKNAKIKLERELIEKILGQCGCTNSTTFEVEVSVQ